MTSVTEKLNIYSLRVQTATEKFNEAFAYQKRYVRAVNRMRYEFSNRLSAEDKQLLEQESFINALLTKLSLFERKCMQKN